MVTSAAAKMAALAVCLGASVLAVANAHDGPHEMTSGMDMAPSPSDHHHSASASVFPSMAAGLLALVVCLLVHGKRI
ncbi:M20_dimer domain-containing protein [Psidium guajava]|nr:M20_dimer domain-containing protein [Psidium guajava]